MNKSVDTSPHEKNRSLDQEMLPSGSKEARWGVPELAHAPERIASLRDTRTARFESLSAEASTMFEPVLEQLVGENNLLPAWWLEEGAARARAVCKVDAAGTDFAGRSGVWSGTGFLVAEGILCTNHHVLNSRDVAARSTIHLDFAALPDGSLRAPATFRLRPDRLFWTSPVVKNGGLDVTFVAVDGAPGRTFGWIPLLRQSFAVAETDRLNIVQHPAGRLKEVALRDNQVVWQDPQVLQYESDTEAGSSGAPVFTDAWELVALHHAASATEVAGGGRKPSNQGIKFAAIATALEQDAQRTGGAAALELLRLFRGTDELLGFFGALGRQKAAAGVGSGLEVVRDTYRGEALDVDVGFWNVEWFNVRWEEKLDAVARVVVEMNLDVWAFSESGEQAMKALVKHLADHYGQTWKYLVSESAPTDVQITAVLWNPSTVTVRPKAWPSKVHRWFRVDSRRFDELGLEAVHGRVFPRYPALFEVDTALAGETARFNLVPLHLKAMGEGSLRRRMASRLLAEAIREVAADDAFDGDWIIGGDYNATLKSGDFDDLAKAGLTPLTAADEGAGQLTYLKGRYRSLIDHVFVSPNLVPARPDDLVIVALDRTLDRFLDVSDHRPVLVRLSAGGATTPQALVEVEPSDADLARLVDDVRRTEDRGVTLSHDAALARIEDRSVYFDAEADAVVRERYWAAASAGGAPSTAAVTRLLRDSHRRQLRYAPSTHVYPWVEVRPNGKLRSIYSGVEADPEAYIRADAEADRLREEARAVMLERGLLESTELESLLESNFPHNCEHVVPQSWYDRREPMRGDLHHLFACEPRCNSFRGNLPFVQFDLERVMHDCGRAEEQSFEPNAGKGAVARATLYFMLRYPGQVGRRYAGTRLDTLLAWHRAEPPDVWEKHRNNAIFVLQGNRNPLIDFPAWADALDFGA